MKLLKRREAVVRAGTTLEKVKLSKAIVQGVDTLRKEREALTRPKTDRTAIANKDLKKLSPVLQRVCACVFRRVSCVCLCVSLTPTVFVCIFKHHALSLLSLGFRDLSFVCAYCSPLSARSNGGYRG
jgi:hypothetical protein